MVVVVVLVVNWCWRSGCGGGDDILCKGGSCNARSSCYSQGTCVGGVDGGVVVVVVVVVMVTAVVVAVLVVVAVVVVVVVVVVVMVAVA